MNNFGEGGAKGTDREDEDHIQSTCKYICKSSTKISVSHFEL